eukprot:TRINITY_DN21726_c0_g2_i1.p1 TRINITY_DN21726_c0_g2~~TRINITY_DN21726_c0_g2_i1.p1  ORF type:complete len:1480 (+),score=255.85 TRINITY_DN21726_c0_g2_i1:167-4606(+)
MAKLLLCLAIVPLLPVNSRTSSQLRFARRLADQAQAASRRLPASPRGEMAGERPKDAKDEGLQTAAEVASVRGLSDRTAQKDADVVPDKRVRRLSMARTDGMFFDDVPVVNKTLFAEHGLTLIGAGKPPRQLADDRTVCSAHSDCGTNEYCMSCQKCTDFHAGLPRDQQPLWTCEPCLDGISICESGQYCTVAGDSVDGTCPTMPGCDAHSDCRDGEYCYSCSGCEDWVDSVSSRVDNLLWKCEPCPNVGKAGFCSMAGWCNGRGDPVDGTCPEQRGCGAHTDCEVGQYCESCDLCAKYQATLPESTRHQWSCWPCPTPDGGICEDLRFCQIAYDGVGQTCPQEHGCNAHAQCLPDEYCSSCTGCATYLSDVSHQNPTWSCNPCPTQRGGSCRMRIFCPVANDSVSGDCPQSTGCSAHTQCGTGEFCMGWQSCVQELGAVECGVETPEGGICVQSRWCSPGRSIDSSCPKAMPCNVHGHCQVGLFCTPWEDCIKRGNSEFCGPEFMHYKGVCIPTEHCIRGLHSPIDGSCPASWRREGELQVVQLLKLNSSTQLAIHHQAMNVWGNGDGSEMILAQLHDYGDGYTTDRRDDDTESVGVWRASSRYTLPQEDDIPLSCSSVEISIPHKKSHFYEARIFMDENDMDAKHAHCSCVQNSGTGACPRGVQFTVAGSSDTKQLAILRPVVFTDEFGFPRPNELTLYRLNRTITAPAKLIDSSKSSGEGPGAQGCPVLRTPSDTAQAWTLEKLGQQTKTYPTAEMNGKFCVVFGGGCPVEDKYRLCVTGGAEAVLVILTEAAQLEEIGSTVEVGVGASEDFDRMVPLLVVDGHNTVPGMTNDVAELITKVQAGEDVTISVGDTISMTLRSGLEPANGGVRVYNTATGQWKEHTSVFSTVRWMEHSTVRDILFVCTEDSDIVAFDASNPATSLPRLGGPTGIKCITSPMLRDYHLVDFRQDDRYYTVVIEPDAIGNELIFYDTTNLGNWRKLSEVHANWEHNQHGLGQVKATHDGRKLVITWHCSTLHCRSLATANEGRGERVYVLDVSNVASTSPPLVDGIIEMPMADGSMVRDVACNDQNLCLVSLTWDGVAVLDLNPGPNRNRVVARHDETFKPAQDFDENLQFMRLVTGAQKVYASDEKANRFYVERWSFDVDAYTAGAKLDDVLRFDTLWSVELTGYQPQPDPDDGLGGLPAKGYLVIDKSLTELLSTLPHGDEEHLQRTVRVALQDALGVDSTRVEVTQIQEESQDSTRIDFVLKPGDGVDSSVLMDRLETQFQRPGSAIWTGPLQALVAHTTLHRIEEASSTPEVTQGFQRRRRRHGGHRGPRGGGPRTVTFALIAVVLLCAVIAACACLFGARMYMRYKAALKTAEQAQEAAMSAQSPAQDVNGFVVGRPEGSPASAFVVGTPVQGVPNAEAAAAAGGAALTQIDAAKLAQDSSPTGAPTGELEAVGEERPATPTTVRAATANRGNLLVGTEGTEGTE